MMEIGEKMTQQFDKTTTTIIGFCGGMQLNFSRLPKRAVGPFTFNDLFSLIRNYSKDCSCKKPVISGKQTLMKRST